MHRFAIFVSLFMFCHIGGQMVAAEPALSGRGFKLPERAEPVSVEKIVNELARQSGLEVDISAIDSSKVVLPNFEKSDFWNMVEWLAGQTDSRVAIGRRGKPVALVPLGKGSRPPVSLDGPFRVAAREVEARVDLAIGKTLYDLTLEVAWEASLPVYRLDAQPTIVKGVDDSARPVTIQPLDTRNPVAGTHTLLRVRLNGLDRKSQRIELLQGELKATAAAEILRFVFDDAAEAGTKKLQGVNVQLKSFTKQGSSWIADVRLQYPANSAEFESFETYWLGRNRFTLISPDGKTKLTSDDPEINGSALTYRFKETADFRPGNLSGWKAEYETPGVIHEAPVRFVLRNIALP